MNRRKVLDVSRRQKSLGKHSSVVALHQNTSAITHTKNPEPSAPPLEKGIQHGDAESCQMSPQPPESHQKSSAQKTKFTSNDKSSEFRCSPRLKSFPAEELRRFDASPRVESTLAPFQMIGDGEFLPQHNKMAHQRLPQSQSIQNKSSHPEVFNVVPLERSPERQTHRPCVPRPMNHENRIITEHQSEGNFLQKREPDEMERQPVGGRNAAMFRSHISGPQQNLQAAMIPEERTLQKDQNQRPNRVQFADDPQEIPQQMYFQNYPQQYLQYPQQFPGLGMTSPQDVLINQSRMYQQQIHPNYHQSFNHPQQEDGPWVQHPNLNSSNRPPVHQHQHQHQHHHQQVQQQPNQGSWSQPSPNTLNYPHVTHNHHQQTVQQPEQREYPCQRGPEDEESSKVLRFTPEMIRDQEKLVGVLRQQGFPDEIVKRHFDGLLAEQQRQLMFLHQLKNPNNSSDASKNMEQSRRRRITRVKEDEKPEWMMHITPPSVSYGTLEQEKEKDEELKRQQGQQNEQEEQKLHQQNVQQQHMQQPMQQMVNPVIYQQYQQQEMMNSNAHHPGQYQHHQQHQQVPNQSQYHQYQHIINQNIPETFPQHQQALQSQNNQELIPQDREARVEPSSLLKLKMNKEVIKRQKQNNGLQDAAAVKEAMEALKNPANRAGFEYLANLEKKERQIKLNGAQDPEQSLLQNWPHQPPDYVLQQLRREERANGLENKRNIDNPPPTIRIQQGSMNESMPVYPRRVDEDQRFYSMQPALVDNGMHQNCASAFKNIGDPSSGYNNNFQAHVNNQVQGGTSGSHQGLNVGRSSSLPFDMYSQQRQEYFQEVPKGCLKGGQGDGSGQEQYYVRGHFEEPRVIGGVKYIGRKLEFIPNSCSPGQY